MTRYISLLCLAAILSAVGQNHGDIWVMPRTDCPITSTIHPLRCAETVEVCAEPEEPAPSASGCCSSGCSAEATSERPRCGMEDPVQPQPERCPESGQRSGCCKLIHPLWADIPTKAVSSNPVLVPVAPLSGELIALVHHSGSFEPDIRPWGIHPSIASTVLRI